jgi:pimeloyl-ACP methyl ester carboxylesterase
VPTLVVDGGLSAVPTGVGEWLAGALANGTSVVVPSAGHAPFGDDARGFNDALARFVPE